MIITALRAVNLKAWGLERVKPYQSDDRMDNCHCDAKSREYHVRNKHWLSKNTHGETQSASYNHQHYHRHPKQKHNLLLFLQGYRFFSYIAPVLRVEFLQYLCAVTRWRGFLSMCRQHSHERQRCHQYYPDKTKNRHPK